MIRDSQLFFCENQNYGGTFAAIDGVYVSSENTIDMGSLNHHAFGSTPLYLCFHITEEASPRASSSTGNSGVQDGIYTVTNYLAASSTPTPGSWDSHGSGDPSAFVDQWQMVETTSVPMSRLNDKYRVAISPYWSNLSNPHGRYWTIRTALSIPGTNSGTDGVSIVGTTFTSASANFVAGDVGRSITINGVGDSSANLTTTIASVGSTTSVVLTDGATTNAGSGKTWSFNTAVTLRMSIWIGTPNESTHLADSESGTSGGTAGRFIS